MKIVIETIPHSEQRYDTCGDWQWKGDNLLIKVSKMSDPYHSFLVAYHELFEAIWCKKNGVTQKQVDEFDMEFEAERAEGLHGDGNEPGDSPHAPYQEGHQVATVLERVAAKFLDVNWKKYDKEVVSL